MRTFLTVHEVRDTLGISQSAVYALVHRADFPTLNVGRKILIPAEAFRSWVVQHTTGDYDKHGA